MRPTGDVETVSAVTHVYFTGSTYEEESQIKVS